jgi:hypothetical protein
MTPMRRTAISACAVLVLSGCAERPFVQTKYEAIIPKPAVTGRMRTGFDICYADGATDQQIWELARETCADFRLQPELQRDIKWQCKMTAPHIARFSCIDPEQPETPKAAPVLPPR